MRMFRHHFIGIVNKTFMSMVSAMIIHNNNNNNVVRYKLSMILFYNLFYCWIVDIITKPKQIFPFVIFVASK